VLTEVLGGDRWCSSGSSHPGALCQGVIFGVVKEGNPVYVEVVENAQMEDDAPEVACFH
jgi:hypothetical protein